MQRESVKCLYYAGRFVIKFMNQHAHNNVLKKQKYDYATFSYKKYFQRYLLKKN